MRLIFWVYAVLLVFGAVALASLGGCAMVQVHVADPADVKTSFYPFGVRIDAQPGAAEGVYVETGNVGLMFTGASVSAGINDATIYLVDADACSLGIVGESTPELRKAAREAAEYCTPQKEIIP